MELLTKARQTQSSLLGKLRGEHPDTVNEHKTIAADMCCELAEVGPLLEPCQVSSHGTNQHRHRAAGASCGA